MRNVCWQTILTKYHTLFFSKNKKDVAKIVVCCSRDWPLRDNRLSKLVLHLYDSIVEKSKQ